VYFFFLKLLIHFKIFYGHNLFHLDNPVPDPVEEKRISNPNPWKILLCSLALQSAAENAAFQPSASIDKRWHCLYSNPPVTVTVSDTGITNVVSAMQHSQLRKLTGRLRF